MKLSLISLSIAMLLLGRTMARPDVGPAIPEKAAIVDDVLQDGTEDVYDELIREVEMDPQIDAEDEFDELSSEVEVEKDPQINEENEESLSAHDPKKKQSPNGNKENVPVACLLAHNKRRRLHADTPDLKWDDGLARDSVKWAKYNAGIGYMKHSSGVYAGKFGENIYYRAWSGKTLHITCEEAVKAWYDEIKDYSYATHKSRNGRQVNHFTQVIWRGTTKVGMGFAMSKRGGMLYVFAVARYLPAGNALGSQKDYTKNVMPLKGASGGSSSGGNRAVKKSSCKDKKPHCAYWKKKGYCTHKWPRWMAKYCAKTCGKC